MKIPNRFMRCINKDTKEFVDIRINIRTGENRKYILLAADELYIRSDYNWRKEYHYYFLFSKKKSGRIDFTNAPKREFAGMDLDGNLISVNIDTLDYKLRILAEEISRT